MKKIALFAIFLWMVSGNGVAHTTSTGPMSYPVYDDTWMQMKAADFIKLKVADFAKICNKKLNLKEKVSFLVLKKNLKRELKKNPTLTVQEFMIVAGQKKISTGVWITIILGVALITLIIIASAGGFGPYM